MTKAALIVLTLAGGLATPALAAQALPTSFDGYAVCSASVTDNCIERYAVRQDLAHAHHHARRADMK